MAPLSGRNLNAQSPFHQSQPTSNRDNQNQTRRARALNENLTSNTTSTKSPSARLLSQTKASAARLNPPSRPQTPNLPVSRLPRRAETPNSARTVVHKPVLHRAIPVKTNTPSGQITLLSHHHHPYPSVVTIGYRNQSVMPSPLDKPLPMDKELPPRPIATYSHTLSPSKHGRTLIDATEKPLRVSPGSPDEADWPTLSPQRRSAMAAASSRNTNGSTTSGFENAPPTIRKLLPYFRDPNVKSHWSVDTPETPASIMPPPSMFDEGESSPRSSAHDPEASSSIKFVSDVDPEWPPLTTLPLEHASRSPPMMDLNANRPRSISLTDRTSAGGTTMSTIDTTEITGNDWTEMTQESQQSHYSSKGLPHSPPPCSFSQPRVAGRRSSLPGTPTPQNSVNHSRHHATASRIPIYDPRKTPNMVDIKPRTPVPSTPGVESIPTFGARRLDTPADLAALDKDPQTYRQPSGQPNEHYGLAKKVSVANMRNQVKRLTPSPINTNQTIDTQDSERIPRRASPTSADTSRDRSVSRIRKLSGQLLSSSFSSTTLAIHDEADAMIMGSSQGRLTDQDAVFTKPAYSHLRHDHIRQQSPELDPGIDAFHDGKQQPSYPFVSDQHNSATQQNAESGFNVTIAANDTRDGRFRPAGVPIVPRDEEDLKQIDTTLSLLEGTPPSTTPSQEEFLAFASTYKKQVKKQIKLPDEAHPVSSKVHETDSNEAMSPDMVHEAVAAAVTQEFIEEAGSSPLDTGSLGSSHAHSIRRPIERMPSYMNPTPASQARRVSKLQLKEDKPPGYPSRASSRVLGSGESDSPKIGLSKITPSKIARLRTGSPGNITPTPGFENNGKLPAVQFPSPVHHMGSSTKLPIAQSSPYLHVDDAGVTRSGRTTPVQPDFKPKHRPRSESKSRLFNNFKGFFTTKREAGTPPMHSVDGKRLNKQSLKANLNTHGDPSHGRSLITVAEPVIPPVYAGKPLPDPHSPQVRTNTRAEETAAVVSVTTALITEAGKESDSTKQERLISLAKVMMDTISNSREAERSMIAAQQAAEAAKMSYEMTQRSVLEMGRLIASSKGSMASVLRKIAVKAGH